VPNSFNYSYTACKCGTVPVKGDIFRYISPYGSEYEATVKSIEGSSIVSEKGIKYACSEVIIITKIKERQKKLDKLL
jgi:hypothetical protein